MLPRLPYEVTERAVQALRDGLERTGWSQARLAREVGIPRQLVNNVLKMREGARHCEYLADMLRALGESELLALSSLTEMERAALEHVHKLSTQLSPERARELLRELERNIEREIALQEKQARATVTEDDGDDDGAGNGPSRGGKIISIRKRRR